VGGGAGGVEGAQVFRDRDGTVLGPIIILMKPEREVDGGCLSL
jgi:hypothetical protein